MTPLLNIQHLDKTIGNFHLSDISLCLEPGYIFGLVGRNGAGKTTLLRTILNLYQKDSGSVVVDGFSMDTQEREAKDRIGFVLDEFLFEKKLSVETNGKLFGASYSQYDHALFTDLCKRFGLNLKQKTGRLSKGEKSRFQLAFALSHQAKLFLMDEPASGLDPLFRKELLSYMQELVEDGTRSILFSTHLTTDLDQIGDYIALMDQGQFFFNMDMESLRDRFLLVEGSRMQIDALKSDHILCKVHESFGSTALLECPEPGLTAGFQIHRPALHELIYYLQKGGLIL